MRTASVNKPLAALVIASAALILPGTLAGCGSSSPEAPPNEGKSTLFVPGVLGFDLECLPILRGDTTGIDVYYGIPTTSLTFLKSGTGFQAECDLTIRVLDERGSALINEDAWQETTYVAHYEETQRTTSIDNVHRVRVPPGRFRVEMRLEQMFDRKSATRTQQVAVPSVNNRLPEIGKVFVRWHEPLRGMIPCVFFHIPSGLDSLEGDVQLFRLPPGTLSTVEFAFERFRYDTSVPKAPYLYAVTVPFQRTYSVEDAGAFDTVLALHGLTLPGSASTTPGFRLPAVTPGLYRISVRAVVPGGSSTGSDTVMTTHRVFSFKGVTFPRPSTLDELIAPLAYLATPEEMKHIVSAATPDERRGRFDLFWLARAPDRNAAAGLLKEYYTRVTDANRYFSGVKEGWKTDAGMVYIILGPPSEAGGTIDAQIWQYAIPGSGANTAFRLNTITVIGDGLSLKDYFLSRDAAYEDPWTRVVSRWRHGSAF